jgi:radial spoke head protein 4A
VKRDAPPRRGAENALGFASAAGGSGGGAQLAAALGGGGMHAGTVAEAAAWARADSAARDLFRTEEEVLEDARRALRERKGYGPPGANEDDDEEVDALELPEPNDGEYPDLLAEQRLLEWAGTGLGAEESYELALSIKRLVEAVPIARARFWGKILGTQGDYYVVESEFRDGERPDSDAEGDDDDLDDDEGSDAGGAGSDGESDAGGSDAGTVGLPPVPKPRKIVAPSVPKEKHMGANRFTYWVADSACGEWVRLPPVTPEQIRCARDVRRYLTGDLRAEVPTHPPFPGREAELLRAQIARITHATRVAPAGTYAAPEDEDEDDPEAEAQPPTIIDPEDPDNEGTGFPALDTAELNDPAAWVHIERCLHAQGRVAHHNPAGDGDGSDAEGGSEDDDDDDALDAFGFAPSETRAYRKRHQGAPEPAPRYMARDPDHPEALAPCDADKEIVEGLIPAFSTRVLGASCPGSGAVALVSRRWPGAVTVVPASKKGPPYMASVYIGYAVKHEESPVTPAGLPPLPAEPVEEVEAEDPDPALELARKERREKRERGDEEEEEEEESDEDEE